MVLYGLEVEILSEGRYAHRRQRTLKVDLGGRRLMVKLFGHRRCPMRTAIRNLSHRLLVSRTSATPAGRCATERRLLDLWRQHGFSVAEPLDVRLPQEPSQPYLVLEFVEGPLARTSLHDPEVDVAAMVPKLEAFWEECGRRHELAIRLREPGLIHTHPGFRHLIDRGGGFTYIDLEDAFTSPRDVERHVCIELAGFLRALDRTVDPDLIEVVSRSYPDVERLERARSEARVGRGVPVRFTPLARRLVRAARWTKRGQGQSVAATRAFEARTRVPVSPENLSSI